MEDEKRKAVLSKLIYQNSFHSHFYSYKIGFPFVDVTVDLCQGEVAVAIAEDVVIHLHVPA